jgi:uncharacterized protein DUF4396
MHHTELNKMAVSATLHCLTGCAIGEVLGTVIGSALGWHNAATMVLAISLAFLFGYSFTVRPLLRGGLGWKRSTRLALASDTLSITTMEIVDTLILLLIPGALMAGPLTVLCWVSLAVALGVAFVCAVPVNRYLIARGKGHALVHDHHK